MKTTTFILSVLLSIILISCKEDNPGKVTEIKVIKPLAVGNSWTYIHHDYIDYPPIPKIDTINFTILKKELIDGEEFYFESMNFDTIVSSYNINRADGLFLRSVYTDSIFPTPKFFQLVKYPVRINDSVFYMELQVTSLESPWGIGMMKIYKKVTAENVIVNVPAGTFSCVEISDKQYGKPYLNYSQTTIDSVIAQSYKVVDYYCYDKGLIKRTLVKTNPDGSKDIRDEMLLMNYIIK
jgi:hypothetical protein